MRQNLNCLKATPESLLEKLIMRYCRGTGMAKAEQLVVVVVVAHL